MKRMVKFLSVVLCVCMLILSQFGCKQKEPGQTAATSGGKTTKSAAKVTTSSKSNSTTKKNETNEMNDNDNDNDNDDDDDATTGDNDHNDDNNNDGDVTGDPADENAGDDESAKLVDYHYDFGGRTIYIGRFNGGYTGPYVPYPPLADGQPHVYGTDPVLDEEWDHARRVEEKLNCKVVQKPYTNAPATSHALLAQEVLAGICNIDIFFTRLLFTKPSLMVNNIIRPVSEFIDFENGDPRFDDPIIKLWTEYEGKYWGIPIWPPANKGGIVYNLDIRDKEGLEDPVELAIKGEWNWETMLDMAKKATRDFDGDGIIDQYGITFWTPSIISGFIAANSGTVVEYNDGKFQFSANNPNTLRTFTYISDLFNLHKVATTDPSVFKKGMALFDNCAQFQGVNMPSEFTSVGIERIRVVGYPIGPDNKTGDLVMDADSLIYYIPASVSDKDAEGIAYLMANLFRTYSHPDMVELNEKTMDNNLARYGDDEVMKNYLKEYYYRTDKNIVNYGAWGTPFTKVQSFLSTNIKNVFSRSDVQIVPYVESIFYDIQSEIDSISKQ